MDHNNSSHRNSRQGHPYHYPNQGAANTYDFGQSENWQSEFEASPQPPTVPQSVSADVQFDPRDLHRISRSTHDAPWTGAQSSHISQLSPDQQRWASNNQGLKAHSIAIQPVNTNFQWQQPSTHASLTASVDSGFESAQVTCSQNPPHILESSSSQDYYHFHAGQRPVYSPSGPPPSVRSDGHLEIPEETTRRRRQKVLVPPCNRCGRKLKNKSDADKHRFQHTKPFRCQENGCGRKDGFATQNDLQRHRKSVHGASPTVGEKKGYICVACPHPTLDTPPKWWPRLDNFKAHIRRKHVDLNEANLISMSASFKPSDAVSESGYASQHGQSQAPEEQGYQRDFSNPVTPSAERHPSYQGDSALFGLSQGHFDDMVAGVGEGQLANPFAGRQSDARFHGPSSGSTGNGNRHRLSGLGDAVLQQLAASPVEPMISPSLDMRGSVPDIHVSQSSFTGQRSMFATIQLDQRPPKRQKVASSLNATDSHVSGHADGEHKCTVCKKIKKRECDLRKHMKRHTRPYGCTFPSCNKRFGSRNDWKRHENSQHFLQEMWRCEYDNTNVSKCGKLAYHVETFANHLARKHQLPRDSPESNDACKSMHLGREGHHHFWCGFCNKLIEQKDSIQQGAWDMRFKHIGDHFDKDNFHIDNWTDIEENKQKRYICNDDRKKEKSTARSGKIDDDSDLGDDGIPIVPGYPVPVSYAPPGHDPGMPAQASMHTLNNRRLSRVNVDVDADNVSDCEWR